MHGACPEFLRKKCINFKNVHKSSDVIAGTS